MATFNGENYPSPSVPSGSIRNSGQVILGGAAPGVNPEPRYLMTVYDSGLSARVTPWVDTLVSLRNAPAPVGTFGDLIVLSVLK